MARVCLCVPVCGICGDQTPGNTVFLGLGASNLPASKPWGWMKSLVSIVSFFTGALVFASAGRRAGPLRRSTLCVSFLVQTLLLVVAVSLIQGGLIPAGSSGGGGAGRPAGGGNQLTQSLLELAPIALLAFQSAGSIACSRALGFSEIPTVVLTSVYFDIASDERLAAVPLAHNPKRNRRVASVVCVLVGAVLGGWLSRCGAGMVAALWLAAGLKLFVAVLWWLWKAL